MESKSFNVLFFFLVFFVVAWGVVLLLQPFFTAIIIAAITAVLCHAPYQWLLKTTRGRASVSAFLACILVLIVIVVPLFYALSLSVNEANTLYQTVGEGQTLVTIVQAVSLQVSRIPVIGQWLSAHVLNIEALSIHLESLSQNAIFFVQAAYQEIAHFFFWVFVMFFALYYFFIDGKRAVEYGIRLSPLRDEHDRMLVERFVSISRATMKGTLLVGAVQGMIGGLMFFVAGIPSPFLWGSVMIFFSVIPVIGGGIIWIPAGLILLLFGNIWQGLFVLGVGSGIMSTIDNVLRPKLVGKDTHMHPLLVFFATLGGIIVFGISGFIIGPIVMALFLALIEIYLHEFHRQLQKYNEAKSGA